MVSELVLPLLKVDIDFHKITVNRSDGTTHDIVAGREVVFKCDASEKHLLEEVFRNPSNYEIVVRSINKEMPLKQASESNKDIPQTTGEFQL